MDRAGAAPRVGCVRHTPRLSRRGKDGFPAEPRKIFASGGIPPRVKEACEAYEIELAEQNLLAPLEEMRARAFALWSFGLAAMIFPHCRIGLFICGEHGRRFLS